MALIQLNDTSVSTAGNYILGDNVSQYSVIRAVGMGFEGVKDAILETDHHEYSLVPILLSNNDQGYICSSSTVLENDDANQPYRAFDSDPHHWSANTASNEWFQIQNTNGKFRTNMFTYYAGTASSSYIYRPSRLSIFGSNNGVNWDRLVLDDTLYPYVELSSRTYHLEDYVEYSYIRCIITMEDGWHAVCRSLLIQDSAIHSHGASRTVSSVRSGNTHTLTIDGYTPMTAQNSELVVPQSLPYAVNIVADPMDIVAVVPSTYRTYKRDADGVPQLVLADITSVSSGLGKSTLNDDLQSLVTMAKVDDLIAKMDSCTYAGRIDSEDDLPTTDVKIGTIYLVGPEGDTHEEFIYTEDGTWERLGSVRSSDVDLSDYTTTDGMNSAISTATSTLSTNLDNMDISVSEKLTDMTTSVDAAIAATDTKVDASLGALTVEVELVGVAPTTWPDKMDDTGVIILVD